MADAALLKSLPDVDLMKQRLRVFAMVDAIMAPGQRSFEFHPKWGKGEVLGAFKDGEGNFFFAWFSRAGAVIRGFQHESAMSPFRHTPPKQWPGLLDALPEKLAYAKTEPAFALDELTFCLWNTNDRWETGKVKRPAGKDPDGAREVLRCFDRRFRDFADRYYGTPLHPDALNQVWFGRPLTPDIVTALNPKADLAEVKAEARLLGWAFAAKGARKAPPPAKVKPRSFGQAEFTVRCEPTYVALVVHGKEIARLGEDVYEELFDSVRARLSGEKAGSSGS